MKRKKRKKTGRPRKYRGSKRVYRGIYIPLELDIELEKEAKQLDVSFNHYVNVVLLLRDKEKIREAIEKGIK